jgi:hypothetical protein
LDKQVLLIRGKVNNRTNQLWVKIIAIGLILVFIPACQITPAQIYIPLAYALTGLCIAILIYPSTTAAVIGLLLGTVLGAAVYNNSLKSNLVKSHRSSPPPVTP